MLVDLTTDWPTPIRGQYVALELGVVVLGAGLYVASKRLPLEETLEVAWMNAGELTVADVTHALNVTLDTAGRILGTLQHRGMARMDQRGDSRVWVFPDIVEKKLPLTEVLRLAGQRNGRVTLQDAADGLSIPLELARATLDKLVELGFAFPAAAEPGFAPGWWEIPGRPEYLDRAQES
jgi:Fic family protein